ncbi:hypothetical protein [Streptomyces sp. SID5643]|uniref:hypothetical protein n=1 Tax=Streptomyces sp. SID5643 TaxID=2690307 RepID=UPI0031FE85D1
MPPRTPRRRGPLAATGSPVEAAVRGLVTGAQQDTVPLPLLPLAATALVTAGALALTGALASRRSP